MVLPVDHPNKDRLEGQTLVPIARHCIIILISLYVTLWCNCFIKLSHQEEAKYWINLIIFLPRQTQWLDNFSETIIHTMPCGNAKRRMMGRTFLISLKKPYLPQKMETSLNLKISTEVYSIFFMLIHKCLEHFSLIRGIFSTFFLQNLI